MSCSPAARQRRPLVEKRLQPRQAASVSPLNRIEKGRRMALSAPGSPISMSEALPEARVLKLGSATPAR